MPETPVPRRCGFPCPAAWGNTITSTRWQRSRAHPVGLAVGALDGALNFCCREEKEGELSERSEFSPSPPCNGNSRRGSPSRARLSLLTFFGKKKKSESAPA